MVHSFIRKKLINSFKSITHGEINLTLPDGEVLSFAGINPGYSADIKIDSWKVVVNLFLKGDVGFTNDYRYGFWSTSNLTNLLLFSIENEKVFNQYGRANFWFRKILRLIYLTQANTIKGSKKNIQFHYDLGNDFYKLWLDPTMTYSSAIFDGVSEDLEQAQLRKYDRIIGKITHPNASILEVGCGWGGFAKRAIDYGHKVTGITLSKEQARHARQVLPAQRATILVEDYRKISGQYDYIVSIEMFEAVGIKYWSTYFAKLKQLLSPHGRILLQIITIDKHLFKNYSKDVDMIRTFIFPGGMLPSEEKLYQQIDKHQLKCNDVYRFGHDYAKTLEHWFDSFSNAYHKIKNLGFDDGFIRVWNMYLSMCIAGFKSQRINVVQMELSHA